CTVGLRSRRNRFPTPHGCLRRPDPSGTGGHGAVPRPVGDNTAPDGDNGFEAATPFVGADSGHCPDPGGSEAIFPLWLWRRGILLRPVRGILQILRDKC